MRIPYATIAGPDDWPRVFGRSGLFHVEIGAGRDSHIVDVGKEHPHRLVLGFEYAKERVERLERKIVAAGLTNTRLLRCDALQGIARFLGPESVEAFYIFCPDPWPKKRHEDRRVVTSASGRLFAARLVPGGAIYLKTDEEAFAAQMVSVLERTPFLRNTHGPGAFAPLEGPLAHQSLFEKKWRKQGKHMYALSYVRTQAP